MAFTERYVTQAAAGGGAGTSGDPWTLAEGFANAVAADSVNILSDGAYSLGATTIAAAGTASSLIRFRGYNSTIGDLEGQGRKADGSLETLNFPAITLTGAITPNTRVVFQNLNISGSLGSALISSSTVDASAIVSCSLLNSASDVAARALLADNNWRLVKSDFECSSATRNAVVDWDSGSQAVGCRIKGGGTDTSHLMDMLNGSLVACTFIASGIEVGVIIGAYSSNLLFFGNTFYGCDKGIRLPNSANGSSPTTFVDNHITDCAVGIDGIYITAPNAILEFNSRTRGNTNSRQNLGDGLNVGEITANNGTPSDDTQDYVDAANDNLRLISGAAGESAGLIAYADVGAYQREPAAAGGGLLVHPGMTGGTNG